MPPQLLAIALRESSMINWEDCWKNGKAIALSFQQGSFLFYKYKLFFWLIVTRFSLLGELTKTIQL